MSMDGQLSKNQALRLEIYDLLECAAAALVICVLIFVFAVKIVNVDGSSMNPTLADRDKLLVSDLFFTPKQGDIVVVKIAEFDSEPLVKRIIATQGQTVDIDFSAGVVYVDGKALDEPYTASPTNDREDFSGPQTVPPGCVFVMGDNRNRSTDSRYSLIGMVDERLIIGRAYITIFPFQHFGSVVSQ